MKLNESSVYYEQGNLFWLSLFCIAFISWQLEDDNIKT